jgi:hypothetical protein
MPMIPPEHTSMPAVLALRMVSIRSSKEWVPHIEGKKERAVSRL